MHQRSISAFLSFLLVACATSPEPAAPEPPAATAAPAAPVQPAEAAEPVAEPAVTHAFVWIRTGPATLPPEEEKRAGEGHFANIERLAADGTLLIAGPFGQVKAEPDLRGIFVFATGDLDEARELVATDPAVAAGVFRVELEPFTSEPPLDGLFELERRALATGESGMRGYVLAVSTRPEEAEEALEPFTEEGLVALSGRLGEAADRALFVLAAETLDEAREVLAFAGDADALGWRLSTWWGSAALERLRQE